MSTYPSQIDAREVNITLKIRGIVSRYQCNRFFFRKTEQEIRKMVNFRGANEIGYKWLYMFYIILVYRN